MRRVLIVDDHPDARDLLAGYLTSRGFETTEAVDGVDAIDRATEDPPDVVLMDIAMPRLDGVEATAKLKADPRTAKVPVIAVTGQARAQEGPSICPPCDAMLLKPVDPERVEIEIRRVLGMPALEPGEDPAATARPRRPPRAVGAPLRILVVTEDATVRAQATEVMQLAGAHVISESSARAALRSDHDPDAVIVDLELPGDDAIEIALDLRARPELDDLVILGLEPEDGAPDEIKPLFDAVLPRDEARGRLPLTIQRALKHVRPAERRPEAVTVHVGDPIYAREGGKKVGSVLEVHREFLLADLGGAGAFVIPSTAVASVRAGKIVLEPTELEDDLREMLGDG